MNLQTKLLSSTFTLLERSTTIAPTKWVQCCQRPLLFFNIFAWQVRWEMVDEWAGLDEGFLPFPLPQSRFYGESLQKKNGSDE